MRQESDEEFGVELHTGRTYGGHLDSDVMAPHTMGRSQHNTHRRRTVWLERTILACALVGVAVLGARLLSLGRYSRDEEYHPSLCYSCNSHCQ